MKKFKKFARAALVMGAALTLAACGSKEPQSSQSSQNSQSADQNGIYTPGTYTGEAQGYGGKVMVAITTDADSITDVKITGDDETPAVGGAALEDLAAQVKEKGADIDGVSGATMTSNAVKAAAADAISAAKGEEPAIKAGSVADGTYTGQGSLFWRDEGDGTGNNLQG